MYNCTVYTRTRRFVHRLCRKSYLDFSIPDSVEGACTRTLIESPALFTKADYATTGEFWGLIILEEQLLDDLQMYLTVNFLKFFKSIS